VITNNLNIILHIGYHKTGTTFLQDKIFSNLSKQEVIFLGQPFFNKNFKNFFQNLKDINELSFDNEFFKNSFIKLLDENYPDYKDKMIIVSLESLHSGFDWFGREVVYMSKKIQSVFPKAKIIIGMRTQATYVEAIYKEFIIHGGKISFQYFLYKSQYFKFILKDKLFYEKVVKLYYKLYSKEQVFVYLQEQMKEDSSLLVNNILDFMEYKDKREFDYSPHYEGLSKISTELIRYINILLVVDTNESIYIRGNSDLWTFKYKLRRRLISLLRHINKLLKLKGKYIGLEDENYINNIYKASNKEFSELLSIDLKKYGFFL
jgi:hypothetical protein